MEVMQQEQEKRNQEALAAVEVRINGVHQEVKAFDSVLSGINDSLVELVQDKRDRDNLANHVNSGPWGKFRDKLVESLATLVAGGVLAFIVWGVMAYVKAHP